MARMGELGTSGLAQFSGNIAESFVPDLRSNSKRIKIFDEMSRIDPVGSTMLRTTRMFLQGAGVHVKRMGDDAASEEMAKFLERNLFGMSKSFGDVIGDIVYFLVYGFMDMELVYKKDEDGRISWKKWAPRHPITLDHWEFDDTGGMQGMWQTGEKGAVLIPIEKLLHFSTTGAGKNNVEGISCFEGAYTSWFYVKNLSILEAVICERLSGTPEIKLPESADTNDDSDDVIKAKRVVRNIKSGDDMGLVLPFGWEFNYRMPSHGPAIDIGNVIRRHQGDEARTMMMDFIMLGGDGVGSYAMSKDKSSLYLIALNTFLDQIAAIINQHAVPRLFELNSFSENVPLPRMYFERISKIDVGDFSDMISSLFNAGAVTYDMGTENQVRRMIGLDEIREPGLLLKPNLPANNLTAGSPETEPVGDVNIPVSQAAVVNNGTRITEKDAKKEEMEPKKLSEAFFADINMALDADAFSRRVGEGVIQLYERALANLPDEVSQADEDEVGIIIDRYMEKFMDDVKGDLAEGMIALWITFVGDRPPLEGYKAIVDELILQADYLEKSLRPAITTAIISKVKELAHSARDIVSDAVRGVLVSFNYRLRLYANALYKLFGNHASAWRAKLLINAHFSRNGVEMNWKVGRLRGDGVLARNVSEHDERVCPECLQMDSLGWTAPENITPIGSRMCAGNDRCRLEYKYHGRVY